MNFPDRPKKAVAILTHPLTLAAIVLYGLNIFVLQPLFPSWWTGKLGDFAWLFFFPYALTAVLAWLLPEGWEERSFALALLISAAGFALAKATAANQWLVGSLEWVFRQPVSISRDPSDLLALLALPGSLWLWKKFRPVSRRTAGLILLPLVLFLTLADSPMPDYGLTHLEARGNAILACSNYGTYQSTDGGLSWDAVSYDSGIRDCGFQSKGLEIVSDPQNSGIQYRYADYAIQRSVDAGQTWQVDYSWWPLSQAEQVYFTVKHPTAYGSYSGTPKSAILDAASGNVIFAMGMEGVLVRQADTGRYAWISVDKYEKISIQKIDLVTNLIAGEYFLALIAGGLGITFLGLRVKKSLWMLIFMLLAMLGWIATVYVFPPALTSQSGYINFVPAVAILLVGGATLVLAILSLVFAGLKAKILLLEFGLAFIGTSLLFMAPYLLWALDVIRQYYLAAVLALILSAGFLIFLWIITPKWIPATRRTQP